MLAAHFTRALGAQPGRLHFAAHSHHPWPDATLAAHDQCWLDAANLLDRKWERVLGEVVPQAQGHVARLLGLGDTRQVAFAPNTHEFVSRLYSCLDPERPARVLTSAHEFHSFRRQTRRLEEAGRITVEKIAAEPWDTFVERFTVGLRLVEPRSEHRGLRASREVSRQILAELADMEREYFAARLGSNHDRE